MSSSLILLSFASLAVAQWDALMMASLSANCTNSAPFDACLAPNGRAGQCRDGNRCDFLPEGTICAQVVERFCYGACEQQSDAGAPCWQGENRGKCAYGCPIAGTQCLRAEAYCDVKAAANPVAPVNCESEADVGKLCAPDEGAATLTGKCAFGCPYGSDGESVQCLRAEAFCDLREADHAARVAACKSLMPAAACQTDTMRGQCKFGSACAPGSTGVCIALAVLQCQPVEGDAAYWRARDACVGQQSGNACSTTEIADGACGYGSNCPPSAEVCDARAVIQCQAKSSTPVDEAEANRAYEASRAACDGKQFQDRCESAPYVAPGTGMCAWVSNCPPYPANQPCLAIARLGCVSSASVPTNNNNVNDPDDQSSAASSVVAVAAIALAFVATLF